MQQSPRGFSSHWIRSLRWPVWIEHILPEACACCARTLDPNAKNAQSHLTNTPFCATCCSDSSKLPTLLSPKCAQCARPLTAESRHDMRCGNCLKTNPAFDATVAFRAYEPPFSDWLLAFKYQRQLAKGRLLARDFVTQLDRHFTPELLLPVPLHPRRQRQRGFNQSIDIARFIGRTLGIEVNTTALRRTKYTQALSSLTQSQRQKMLKGAFGLSPDANISARHVAIIDDVMTSGSTANEIAKLLKQAGAESVSVWVLCRAIY